jgi:hypothetical protein
MVERVCEKVHIAALPVGAGQDLADRLAQTFMIVRDDKLDAERATFFEPEQKITPAGPALAVGEIDAEDLAPTFAIDRHRDQHRLADADTSLTDLLVARIEDQIGERLIQTSSGKTPSRRRPMTC